MRPILIWTAALWAALASGLAAQNNPVVVELFTSQGCSSCPPADALLADLAGRDDVIPLALHVDYWDYIGWKDKFAMPAFTERQKGYARAGGWRRIYTPQMVIDGAHDVVGSNPMKVADLIRKSAMQDDTVSVALTRTGNSLSIRAEAGPGAGNGSYDLQIVRYKPSQTIAIQRGENAGREITYSHIVRSWDTVARWAGGNVYETTVPVTGSDPIVVLVQKPRYGAIVAAARLR